MAIFLPKWERLFIQLSWIRRSKQRYKAGHLFGSYPFERHRPRRGVFYEFSTMQIPRANGFALTTGISTLSCQVQGMNLDLSGPKDALTGSTATK